MEYRSETYEIANGVVRLYFTGSFRAVVYLDGKQTGSVLSYINAGTGAFVGWGFPGSKFNTYANARQAAYALINGE
jgi:hypothetical protein